MKNTNLSEVHGIKTLNNDEKCLYEIAIVIENDSELHSEMKEWDNTVLDGLEAVDY